MRKQSSSLRGCDEQTARNYLNATVKCQHRMHPSAVQPFHYYEIFVIEKKHTHMSIGVTDHEWHVRGAAIVQHAPKSHI